MKGKYQFQLSTKKLSFNISVKRKYTIIRGDSATGKSTLADYVLNHNLRGNDSGVYIKCDVPVKRAISADDIENNKSDCIFIIDEGDACLKLNNIGSILSDSPCYFIIITRQKMGYIPYSLSEIYELESHAVNNKFTESFIKNRFYNNDHDIISPDIIITEDEGTGFDFFERNFLCKCLTSKGKEGIVNKICDVVSEDKFKNIFIICDGAAIGSEIEDIIDCIKLFSSDAYICVSTPESFEFLILSSELFNFGETAKKLMYTYDYCDAVDYDSWEQFFTDLLENTAKKYHLNYNKKIMDKFFYDNADKILRQIKNLKYNAE